MKIVVRGPALEVRVESGLLALELDQDALSKERDWVSKVEKIVRWERTLMVSVDLILGSHIVSAVVVASG